jgi:hypothetical protein
MANKGSWSHNNHYTKITFCVYGYEWEMTGSHLTRVETFSFSASLNLGRYKRQPTDTTSYGPSQTQTQVRPLKKDGVKGGDSILSVFSWEPLRVKLQNY